MKKFIYVDYSNLFIEGRRVAAANRNNDNNRKTFDRNYHIDFGKLYSFVTQNGDDETIRALLVGSRPPPNDSLWALAKSAGFELEIINRNVANKEKGVDTTIVCQMTRDAYRGDGPANHKIFLIAGDGDYIPPAATLVKDGFTVEVVFWAQTSVELQRVCSKFTKLDSHLDELALHSSKPKNQR